MCKRPDEGAKVFADIDDALSAARNNDRYSVCADCVKSISESWRDRDKDPKQQVEWDAESEDLTKEELDDLADLFAELNTEDGKDVVVDVVCAVDDGTIGKLIAMARRALQR